MTSFTEQAVKAPLSTTAPAEKDTPYSSTTPLTEGRVLFLVTAATVLVYANSLGGEFVFDDTKQIVDNPQLRSWGNILHAFARDVWDFQRGTTTSDIPPPYYRPLFTFYLTLGYQLFGLWEPGWHLMNLAVHTGATLAVYYLLRRLCGHWTTAALAAFLFGVHPVHVESVAWISGIPDPLAALFYVPALLWYVRYREGGGRKFLASSLLAYGLSVLCKETALALPLVLAAWEVTRGTSSWSARLYRTTRSLAPYALVAAGYLTVRFAVLGMLSWKHPMMAAVPDSAIWMTVPFVMLSYLRHLVAPFHLSLIYGTSFTANLASSQFLVPAAILSGLAFVVWIYRQKVEREMWIALVLLVAPLLPVLNLKVFHHEYIIQDRYLYLPSIGFCYLIALWIVRVSNRRAKLAAGLTATMLLAFCVSTTLQNRMWHDSVALWERAIEHAPHSWSTHYNIGLAYLERRQYEAARVQLLEASRLKADEPTVYNNLALAQAGLGEAGGAIGSLRHALALNPRMVEAHNNLGTIFFRRGDYQAARDEFSQSLARDPSSHSARFNLAQTLAAMGDHAAAIREGQTLLVNKPEDAEARYHLALSYVGTGRKADAVTQLERALELEHDQRRIDQIRRLLEQTAQR